VISQQQLRAAGMTDREVARAVQAGRLHRVHRGAYALGHPKVNEKGRLLAATLACGKASFISHRSAATLLGLLDKGPVVIDVIAPPERGRKIDGIRFHRVRPPRLEETGTVAGIPCTSPARTFVDLAGTVGDWTLRSCFERAAQRKLLDVPAIEASMDSGRRGMPSLRKLVDEWRQAAPVAKKGKLKSPLEAKVLPLVLRRNLPVPRLNAPVQIADGRIEVDFLWPEAKFVVEADSRDFHATHVAFERDRWRDRELMRAGYASLRVTHREAEQEPEAIADTVATTLAVRLPTSPRSRLAQQSDLVV
jgi:very-short-patch-repair endonuclease